MVVLAVGYYWVVPDVTAAVKIHTLDGKITWMDYDAREASRLAAAGLVAAPLLFLVVSGVIMPSRDHRAPTVEFPREATAQVPADEPLYVVGLAQSAVYPYIQHAWKGTHKFEDLRQAIDRAGSRSVWILTEHRFLPTGRGHGIEFESVAAEPVRRKYPESKTLVLGRISRAITATAPVDDGQRRP